MIPSGPIKSSQLLALTAIIFGVIGLLPVPAQAGNFQNVGSEFEDAGIAAYGGKPPSLQASVAGIIQYALSVLGILFLALTVYGGFMWMTARGEEKRVAEARNILTQAVVGLAIVLLSYGITEFVLRALVEAI